MSPQARIVIEAVAPVTPSRFPAKAICGRPIRIGATIYRDGHGLIAARLRWRHAGSTTWHAVPMRAGLDDRFEGSVTVDEVGPVEVVVDAWTRRYATWRRDVERFLEVGDDITAELIDGAALLVELAELPGLTSDQRRRLERAAATLRSEGCALRVRLAAGFDDALVALTDTIADPHDLTTSEAIPFRVERERAAVGAWYEFFPRSEGGLRASVSRLAAIAEMGFDVVYLPPIHPIGLTNRKGRGNSLVASPDDVGSPWAIGSPAGGHDAVEPSIGTLEDFDHFVSAAAALGLEVALDYALQCSPDHPWVSKHPEWFRRRSDGTIRYAENPPKRYQDIHPLEFWPPSDDDRAALWEACADILRFWIGHGVRIFRVDNPHTKPLAFWEWLLPEIWAEDPEVVFLAEAFTHPAMMHRLGEIGFSQSYTYFTWRHEPWEVRSYLEELAFGPAAAWFRPNLWPTTPDILAGVLRNGNRAAFQLRALLAALLSPSYGIYSGYELCENRPASPDNEEFWDSEKYRIVRRDWTRPDSLAPFLATLNRIRRSEPAFGFLEELRFLHVEGDQLLAWRKGDLVVVANFDTHAAREGMVHLDRPPTGRYTVTDLLDGARYQWEGPANYVRLDPEHRVAHVLRIEQGSPSA
jgi:starch synthase (maltosyl-transferring)